MYKRQYHGYANTESYFVDPRFGGNEAYRKLIDECHKRGLSLLPLFLFLLLSSLLALFFLPLLPP
ncbi:alpha-amylase family glycosyl hydrolase, partial [Sphingobacterium daejeonense]|uniref:alpha-amylase family glycosyl hydrolase n=1 Tax=Sphingobacterium daejeonense TaxID=371142 RepID=UPI003D315950